MPPQTDFYAVLGVKKDAQIEEIRRAYRKQAILYHPDRNPGNVVAETKFKGISEAYGILSDAEKRKKYDQSRLAPAPAPNYPVADVSVEVELDARDFANGADKTVTVSRPRTCPDCHGSGRIATRYQSTCSLCHGTGCQPCEWTGRVTFCARCWGTGHDREITLIMVRVPPETPPYGRQKFVAYGELWGLRGPFYVYANVTHKVDRPGLIVR